MPERTILLVDDELTIRLTVRRLLERSGYTVVEAEGGREALDLWPSVAGTVDLLLTDVRMPDVGGPELAARLRRERPDLPILFLTGSSLADVGDAPAGTASIPVVHKPLEAAKLLAALEKLFDSTR